MPKVRQLKPASSDQILEAADRVFTKYGYGETSLRQLMSEAGMSPTAFYARYRSKQMVLEALVGRLLAHVFTVASSTFASSRDLDESFDATAQALVLAFSSQKTVVRLAITEAAVLPTLRRTLHGAYMALAQLVASYLAKRRVPKAETAGWAMIGAIYIQLMRWAVFEEIDDAELADELRTTARLLRTTVP